MAPALLLGLCAGAVLRIRAVRRKELLAHLLCAGLPLLRAFAIEHLHPCRVHALLLGPSARAHSVALCRGALAEHCRPRKLDAGRLDRGARTEADGKLHAELRGQGGLPRSLNRRTPTLLLVFAGAPKFLAVTLVVDLAARRGAACVGMLARAPAGLARPRAPRQDALLGHRAHHGVARVLAVVLVVVLAVGHAAAPRVVLAAVLVVVLVVVVVVVLVVMRPGPSELGVACDVVLGAVAAESGAFDASGAGDAEILAAGKAGLALRRLGGAQRRSRTHHGVARMVALAAVLVVLVVVPRMVLVLVLVVVLVVMLVVVPVEPPAGAGPRLGELGVAGDVVLRPAAPHGSPRDTAVGRDAEVLALREALLASAADCRGKR
mmetsp:Transcript_14458/g.38694  ORF Transcript_14458/g.38694 Transcript_14458/m.38694 type:complete len:378 (+) Transcript_14458:652-1785(+)